MLAMIDICGSGRRVVWWRVGLSENCHGYGFSTLLCIRLENNPAKWKVRGIHSTTTRLVPLANCLCPWLWKLPTTTDANRTLRFLSTNWSCGHDELPMDFHGPGTVRLDGIEANSQWYLQGATRDHWKPKKILHLRRREVQADNFFFWNSRLLFLIQETLSNEKRSPDSRNMHPSVKCIRKCRTENFAG